MDSIFFWISLGPKTFLTIGVDLQGARLTNVPTLTSGGFSRREVRFARKSLRSLFEKVPVVVWIVEAMFDDGDEVLY